MHLLQKVDNSFLEFGKNLQLNELKTTQNFYKMLHLNQSTYITFSIKPDIKRN